MSFSVFLLCLETEKKFLPLNCAIDVWGQCRFEIVQTVAALMHELQKRHSDRSVNFAAKVYAIFIINQCVSFDQGRWS